MHVFVVVEIIPLFLGDLLLFWVDFLISSYRRKNMKPYLCKHCGERRSKKFKGSSKSICGQCNAIIYKRNKKSFAVAYKGGKCERCGYDKCLASLDFHHRNPDEKEHNPSDMMDWSKDRVKKELDKCSILCSNCHREEHDRIRNEKYNTPLTTKTYDICQEDN